jgi:hypothetical protein
MGPGDTSGSSAGLAQAARHRRTGHTRPALASRIRVTAASARITPRLADRPGLAHLVPNPGRARQAAMSPRRRRPSSPSRIRSHDGHQEDACGPGLAQHMPQLLSTIERVHGNLLGRFAPGERVAVWAPNIPEWIVLEFGAALAGPRNHLPGVQRTGGGAGYRSAFQQAQPLRLRSVVRLLA